MDDSDRIYRFAQEHVIPASGLPAMLMPQVLDVAMVIKTLDGRYRLINRAMQGLFGLDAEQMLDLTDDALFPPAVSVVLRRSDRQIIDGASLTTDTLRMELAGKVSEFQCTKFPLHGADGRICFIGVVLFGPCCTDRLASMRASLDRLQKANQVLQETLVELDHQASTDRLTGAWSRRRLEEALLSEMDRLHRYDHALSLLVVDVDHFKTINDEWGHQAGDLVLAQLARVVKTNLRGADSLTRWGGEEFVILCPNTNLATAAVLAERLRQGVWAADFSAVGKVTVSIGVAECETAETWDEWFRRADEAMYQAKTLGRNKVQVAQATCHSRRRGDDPASGTHLVNLTWHSSYECGHELIDGQHRRLFDDANKLLGAILSGRSQVEVTMLVERLIADVVRHFAYEEAVFGATAYPGDADHTAVHRRLTDDAYALAADFRVGRLAIGGLFKFLAQDLVARHMLDTDRAYFPYLQLPPG